MSRGSTVDGPIADVGLLAPPALVCGAAFATALRLARGGPVLAVVVRPPEPERIPVPMPPPTPAAVRVAARLRGRGHPAMATWRLVRSDVTSLAEAELVLRCVASTVDLPKVLAVAIARTDGCDALLRKCAVLLLASDDEAGHLVAEASRCSGHRLKLESAGPSIALAHAGIAAPPAWVEPIDRALTADG